MAKKKASVNVDEEEVQDIMDTEEVEETTQDSIDAEDAVEAAPVSTAAPASTLPASLAPKDEPKKAPEAPVGKKNLIDYNVRAAKNPLANIDTTTLFVDSPDRDEQLREVPCQCIKDFSGCIGLGIKYKFKYADVVMLPKWFALSHPKTLVIKE